MAAKSTAAPRTGSKKKQRWWEHPLALALVTAVAGIAGVGFGAIATYYGNRDLQEEQSEDAARGVARVLSAQLEAVKGRFELSLEEGVLILPDPATTVALRTSDEQLLAANLDSDSWNHVALALLALQMEIQASQPNLLNKPALEAHAGLRVPLDNQMRERNRSTLQTLSDSIAAVKPLAESD